MNYEIRNTLAQGLDDYTTDQRGDIGMIIRLAAIDAVSAKCESTSDADKGFLYDLMPRVVRLAAEKMDKVRFAAWCCLEKFSKSSSELPAWTRSASLPTNLDRGLSDRLRSFNYVNETYSEEYFQEILLLQDAEWLSVDLLEGYVTSAGIAATSTLYAARTSLIQYAEAAQARQPNHTGNLFESLLQVLERNLTNDRFAIAALEVIGLLFDMNIFGNSALASNIK